MVYNFDKEIDRRGTGSMKWDRNHKFENITDRDDINSLWVADMDFPCSDAIVKAMLKRAEHPAYGYTYFDESEFFESVMNWNCRYYSRKVDIKNIFYAPGVVYAIAAAINAFSDVGDGVIIQSPVYYPFKMMIENNGRKVADNPLINKNNFYLMDFDALEKTASENDVKLMILCSPHNPVGRVWTKSELKQVSDICAKNNVLLLCDEIHSDMIWGNNKFISASSTGNSDNIITFNAPSKTFNIPGLMVSWVIIENNSLKERWKDEAYGKTGMNLPNPFGLVAARAAYNESDDWLIQVKKYIEGNLLYMKKYIDENMPLISYEVPEGTYLAWLDFNNTIYNDDNMFSDLLGEKLGILVDPGNIFGEQGKGFIRINAACPRHRLTEALRKISLIL
ncbi:MAG: pyridoxal phosphate-dependent aminotransferase [Clostridiales bacterium]|nr:pyridoxal phosphate-dependent aminotransferase [Clostridiales bacterium]